MFDIGISELIVIFVVALLVVGPKKLPELGKSLGKGLAELKKSLDGVKEQMDTELHDIQRPATMDNSTEKPTDGQERKAPYETALPATEEPHEADKTSVAKNEHDANSAALKDTQKKDTTEDLTG
ncbi:MAG: Sec-independent protein translocase protein TatB [Dissulfurispiraceae bacterium]